MPEHALGERQPRRQEEGRPEDRVEPHDVLADDVDVGRPVAPKAAPVVREAGAGQVVVQGVDPDVHDVLRVAGNGQAPVEGRAADGEVLQAAADEADDLVAPRPRPHEVGVLLVEREEPLPVGREAEEVAFLLDPLDRRARGPPARSVGADRDLALVEIGLVPHRVPAGVARQVDVAVRFHAPPELLRGGQVVGVGRADEAVERAVHPLRHGAEPARKVVDEGARGDAVAERGLLNLQAVLVRAGHEEHVVPVEALEARDGVGRDDLVGVADMGRAIRVGDRGRDVVGGGSHRAGHLGRRCAAQAALRTASARSPNIDTRRGRRSRL